MKEDYKLIWKDFTTRLNALVGLLIATLLVIPFVLQIISVKTYFKCVRAALLPDSDTYKELVEYEEEIS